MKFLRANIFYVIILCTSLVVLAANNSEAPPSPLKTCIISPIEIETAEILVPIAKAGPFINEGCNPQLNCTFTFSAPPKLNHRKDPNCPPGLAGILAEYTSAASHCDLPLTIFNGWQWECLYALGPRRTAAYDLIGEGGWWECAWEAKMRIICSSAALKTIQISEDWQIVAPQDKPAQTSNIELITFSDIRTRDGYPKERKL